MYKLKKETEDACVEVIVGDSYKKMLGGLTRMRIKVFGLNNRERQAAIATEIEMESFQDAVKRIMSDIRRDLGRSPEISAKSSISARPPVRYIKGEDRDA